MLGAATAIPLADLLDRGVDEAKRSLRVAAVIGRQFPIRVLERVIGGER